MVCQARLLGTCLGPTCFVGYILIHFNLENFCTKVIIQGQKLQLFHVAVTVINISKIYHYYEKFLSFLEWLKRLLVIYQSSPNLFVQFVFRRSGLLIPTFLRPPLAGVMAGANFTNIVSSSFEHCRLLNFFFTNLASNHSR